MRHLSLSVSLLVIASAAQAEPTISQLEATARAIQSQLQMSNTLSLGASYYATTGGVIQNNSLDAGHITNQMMTDYNAAIDAVIQANYASAQDIFLQEHQNAMGNLNAAVNSLVSATAVLASVGAVADMAASADTYQEQTALQTMLATDPGLQVTQVEVNNYNASLDAVESYAQQAGSFLAAANNSSLTQAVDSFAASSNVAVGAYTAVTYTQSIDQYIITWGNDGFTGGWTGYNTGNIFDAADVYGAGVYVSGGSM